MISLFFIREFKMKVDLIETDFNLGSSHTKKLLFNVTTLKLKLKFLHYYASSEQSFRKDFS